MIRKIGPGEKAPYQLLLDADPSPCMIARYLAHSDIYLALLQEEVTGVYVLCAVDDRTVEIKNIAVAESHQRRGVGTLMLMDAARRAKEAGFSFAKIGTANSSVWQLYLYQRQGFEISSIIPNFFTDHYPEPLYENGIRTKHMIMLTKEL